MKRTEFPRIFAMNRQTAAKPFPSAPPTAPLLDLDFFLATLLIVKDE
jgi:hypothetical protein